MVALDLRFAAPGVTEADWRALEPEVLTAQQQLFNGEGWAQGGSGWLHLPSATLRQGLDSLCTVADELRAQADAVVVVGVGGSSLGTQAALAWCKPAYYNQLPARERGGPELYFAGHSLSAAALRDLLRVLQGKRVGLLVVSKSGATTEPALAFRVLWSWLVTHVGQAEACRRTVVITDAATGALRRFATEHGCRSFAIPADVGGRYSVLTPVGLLPLAVAGVDVQQLLQGAADAESALAVPRLDDNPSCLYAAVRNALYRKGKCIELLAYYEPAAAGLAEWWKQLFGESEGKEGKGLFPAVAGYTADLHALGQYVQEGRRLLFETLLHIASPRSGLALPTVTGLSDGWDDLAGRSLGWVNELALLATEVAHWEGGVPCLRVTVPDQSERSLGQLFYFFELACALSGRLLGVNPFDQPGVEAYKRNLYALLGQRGREAERDRLWAMWAAAQG